MQTPKYSLEESKAITAGTMLSFNVNCSQVIRNLVLNFKNSGSASTLSDITTYVSRIVVLLKGVNVLDVSAQQLVDLYNYLGNKKGGVALANALPLNVGELIYNFGGMRDEFAWRCGKTGEADPSKRIDSLIVQIYTTSSMTGITDVELYSSRIPVEADWNDSYIQFNANPITFNGTGQSQVNTLPKDTDDLMLLAVAYNGGGVISAGETLYNNDNITRNVDAATNKLLNDINGFSDISNAFVHNYSTGAANSGLLIKNSAYQYSVRTTFATAPSAGTYDICLLKVHNCPAKLKQVVESTGLIALDTAA